MTTFEKNWYTIDIDVASAIRTGFDYAALIANKSFIEKNHCGMWQYSGAGLTEFFNESWIQYMKDIGLELDSILLFYREPNFIHTESHVDLPDTTHIAINWVLGEDDSEMIWYQNPDYTNNTLRVTPTGSVYKSWPIEELVEVDRRCLGNTPTLVRVDVPHNIQVNNNPRWAISARCDTTKFMNGAPPVWKNVVTKFQKYIVK